VALLQEELKTPPPRVPWPLPPPSPRDTLEVGVEEWRASTLRIIDERMALFDTPEKQPRPVASPALSDFPHGNPHHALGLNELLEMILLYATPKSQFAAWNVSKGWGDMVAHILQNLFRVPYPCGPVGYGDAIPPNLNWLQPSDTELAHFQETLAILTGPSPQWKIPDSFLAARLSHAEKLPQSTSDAFRMFSEVNFSFGIWDGPILRADGPCWMDLSQFQVNPYFVDLLGDSLQLSQGSWAITIKPHLEHHLSNHALINGRNNVHDMFLTSPPCKVLGIYALSMGNTLLQLVSRIRRVDGIRIEDLLPQIRQHISTAIEHWRDSSQPMRQRIAEGRWTRFSSSHNKGQAWSRPGLPKLLVFLESAEQSGPTFAQCVYFSCQERPRVWVDEWNQPV